MAGGGVGAPSTVTTGKPASATTVPAGNPLDGSPAFKPVVPVDQSSPAVAAPAISPAGPATTASGTPFTGLPPWLSQWSGASFGGAPAMSGQPANSNYQPYVPGTSMSGYGASRPPVVYQPPSKPAVAAAATPAGGMPDAPGFWGGGGQLSSDQQKMMDWFKSYDYNRSIENAAMSR